MKRERQIQKHFFVNEEEDKIIKKKMVEARKNNFSYYARELVLNGEIKLIDFDLNKKCKI